MLVKYIVILYCFVKPPGCYSGSIPRDIDSAKQDLVTHGQGIIPDVDLCSRKHIRAFCSNNETQERVCSARLVKEKIEFKEFDNTCYMDLNNVCESINNIWAIKNLGPCDLRRYAKEIKQMDNDTNFFELPFEVDDNKTAENYQEGFTRDNDEIVVGVTNQNSTRNRRIGDVEDVTADDIDKRMPDDEATTTVNDTANADEPADAEEATIAADTEVEDVTTINEEDITIPEDENANIKAEEDEPVDAEKATIASDIVDDIIISEDTTIAEDENVSIKVEEDEAGYTETATITSDIVDDTKVSEDDTTITEDENATIKAEEDEAGNAETAAMATDTVEGDATTIIDEDTTIAVDENATEDTTDSVDDNTTNDTTTPAKDTDKPIDEEHAALRMENGDNLKLGSGEIGKILEGGTVKSILRQAARFPPMRANLTYNNKSCSLRIKPCPLIYYPVCLYHERENPDLVKYYYFINRCEAEQYTCYHPEIGITPTSGISLRTGFCSHIQYINYARFLHTMSAWGHYGWLRGPWRFNHILKPYQRG